MRIKETNKFEMFQVNERQQAEYEKKQRFTAKNEA